MKIFKVCAISVIVAVSVVPILMGSEASIPLCSETNGVPYATLCQYGTTSSLINRERTERPLYAIMFGDTRRAEQLSNAWMKHFGANGLDGTVFVHPTDRPAGTWKKATFRRPKNIEEAKKFAEDNKSFYEETYGTSDILPMPIGNLSTEELAMIDYIVAYLDKSGSKIYLGAVDVKAAGKLLKALDGSIPKEF